MDEHGKFHSREWWERHPETPRCVGIWTKQGRCHAEALPGTSNCGRFPHRKPTYDALGLVV